jgi:hypothetical protein
MIYKPGKSLTEDTSYRPISVPPIFAKISESLLLSRIEKQYDSSS